MGRKKKIVSTYSKELKTSGVSLSEKLLKIMDDDSIICPKIRQQRIREVMNEYYQ